MSLYIEKRKTKMSKTFTFQESQELERLVHMAITMLEPGVSVKTTCNSKVVLVIGRLLVCGLRVEKQNER